MRRREPPPSGAAAGVEGEIERVDLDGSIAGWCRSAAEPGQSRNVAVTLDGHIVARAACDRPSPHGPCGFLVRLPARLVQPGGAAELAVRDIATGQLVAPARQIRWGAAPGLPPAAAPAAAVPLQGNLDRVTRDGWVAGWCWDPARPAARVLLEVLVDEAVVGATLAANWRPDLLPAGIGDGHHGFSFALPYEVLAARGTLRIRVREAASGPGGGRALGDAVTLRIGLQADGEQRLQELEREVRLLRGRLEAFAREAEARPPAEEQATRAMFGTIAAFFQELADGRADEARGFGLGTGLRETLAGLRGRLVQLSLRRPEAPADTLLIVPATAAVDAVHRCVAALGAAGVDARAELRLVDPGDADAACALLPALVPGMPYQACASDGLVAAVAAALREPAWRRVGIVDPRVEIGPSWLVALQETLDAEPGAGLAGAPVSGFDGLLRHSGFRFAPGGLLEEAAPFADGAAARQRYLRRVDALAPLALLLERELVAAAGGLDPAFRELTHAVAELCARLRRNGAGVLCQPAAAATWAGDQAADPATLLPELTGPGEDSRRLRLRLLEAAAPAPDVGQALFIEDGVPRPDRDAGSVIAVEYMRALRRLGWHVTFAPANGQPGDAVATSRLERLGIEVAAPPDDASVAQILEARGRDLRLVWITRHANFARLAPLVRAQAAGARLLFAPADLHFLRERREAALTRRGARAAAATRAAELACTVAADATVLLSTAERDALRGEGADPARLCVLPWIARQVPRGPGFAEREGLLFVGGFSHRPNADAVLWYARAIGPLVRRLRPGLLLHVVGADPPEAVRALAGTDVRVHGWVEDLSTLLGQVRLTVAPLRYGAGFKGKVPTSLAHGVPVVATAMALEGTGLGDGDGVALADAAADFAAAVVSVHDDATRWGELAARARERVASLYAPEAGAAALATVLQGLGLPLAPAHTGAREV